MFGMGRISCQGKMIPSLPSLPSQGFGMLCSPLEQPKIHVPKSSAPSLSPVSPGKLGAAESGNCPSPPPPALIRGQREAGSSSEERGLRRDPRPLLHHSGWNFPGMRDEAPVGSLGAAGAGTAAAPSRTGSDPSSGAKNIPKLLRERAERGPGIDFPGSASCRMKPERQEPRGQAESAIKRCHLLSASHPEPGTRGWGGGAGPRGPPGRMWRRK